MKIGSNFRESVGTVCLTGFAFGMILLMAVMILWKL